MQTNKEAEQVTLSDLGICCGKMFQEPSPAELPKARTSVSSSKRSSELSAVPFMSLDLTPGHGNLLGESYWELISPWLGGAWMLNTGVSPNDARGSSLSQILQDAPPINIIYPRRHAWGSCAELLNAEKLCRRSWNGR